MGMGQGARLLTGKRVMTDNGPLSELFAYHLRELRQRISVSLLAVVVAAGVVYPFRLQISRFLCRPLAARMPEFNGLVYTNLPEAFIAYLKLAAILGLLLASPVLIFNLWRFISPGLRPEEKRAALGVVLTGSLLFFTGVAFYYLVALPRMLVFFLWFEGGRFEPVLKLGGYLGFVVRGGLVFGLAFEIPFLVAAAIRTGAVRRQYFREKRLAFYLGLTVIAFLLAAGDVVATLFLAVPLALLQEIGVMLSGPNSSPDE